MPPPPLPTVPVRTLPLRTVTMLPASPSGQVVLGTPQGAAVDRCARAVASNDATYGVEVMRCALQTRGLLNPFSSLQLPTLATQFWQRVAVASSNIQRALLRAELGDQALATADRFRETSGRTEVTPA